MLDFLHKNSIPGYSCKVMDIAAKFSQYDIIQWVQSKSLPVSIDTIYFAISNGDLDAVKFLLENNTRFKFYATGFSVLAAEKKKWGIFKWIIESSNIDIHHNCFMPIVEDGNVELLAYVLDKTSNRP